VGRYHAGDDPRRPVRLALRPPRRHHPSPLRHPLHSRPHLGLLTRHGSPGAARTHPEWVGRCLGQLAGALAYLEREAAWPWFFGEQLTQADVTLGCLVYYLRTRLDEAFPRGRYPALEGVTARCDALDAFRATLPSPDEAMPAAGTVRRA